MSESVLFVVHCETMFEEHMSQDFHSKLAEEVYSGGYTRVIVLESFFVGDGENDRLPYLFGSRIESEEWSWGYEPDMFEDDQEELPYVVPGCWQHEWTWVPPFIRDNPEYWRNVEVYVAGGCDGECLEDWRCVLNHMDIPFGETGIVY